MPSPVKSLNRIFQNLKDIKVSPPLKDLFLSIFIGLVIAGALSSGLFDKFEYIILDNMFRLRGERSANNKIVIVAIDDKSLEHLGRWPWPRDYHATFLQILNQYKPKFVAFDILFPEPDPDGDPALAKVAGEDKNLYLASYFVLEKDVDEIPPGTEFENKLPPLNYELKGKDNFLKAKAITLPVKELMEAAKGVTVINAPHDSDGAVRHAPLVIGFNNKLYPSAGLMLACDYLGIDMNSIKVEPGAIRLPHKGGDIRIPIDTSGKMMLNFSGPITAFEQYSYIQLLHDYDFSLREGRKSILENLRGKIVLVGQTATGSVDLRIMPFSNLYPAVGVHATALGNILDKNLLGKASSALNIFMVMLASVLLGLIVKRGKKVVTNLAVMFGLFLSYGILSFLLFSYKNIWISTFSPLVAILTTYVALSISHYEAVRYEKKVMESELLIARKIQQSFLPKAYPKIQFLEFAARCVPAKHVGGDLYDFVQLAGGKIGIAIGDVSGKGVPAALYMARAISELRSVSRSNSDAAGTLKAINDVFVMEGMEKAFITMQYVIFDLAVRDRTVFSNGGHNTLLHFTKKANKIEEISTEGGMPLGLMDGVEFDNKEISLDKGDILFLYTDGISEAMDRHREQFGLEKVKGIIINNAVRSAEEIMSSIYEEISRFSRGVPQHDDMTVVVIKVV